MKTAIKFSIICLLTCAVVYAGFLAFKKFPASYTTRFQKPSAQTSIEKSDGNVKSNEPVVLTDKGPAPDIKNATEWINSQPLSLEGLKDKVVLINFWTYSNIQSIKMSEWLAKMHNQYSIDGLVVIGVHTPQFNFEKVSAGVEMAIKRYNIPYPIVQDNNYKIWQDYQNQFWPTSYLIDKQGNIVYSVIGGDEGEKLEQAIRMVLGLEGDYAVPDSATNANTSDLYLGLIRLAKFGGAEKPSDKEQIFVFPKKLGKDKFALEGKWSFGQESVMHTQGYGRLKLNFNARKVSFVAQSTSEVPIKIYIDGALTKAVVIDKAQIYELYSAEQRNAHTLELEIPRGGFEIFSFSFE